MSDELVPTNPSRTVIGGRHGSPSVTVAFPFSKIANVDSEAPRLRRGEPSTWSPTSRQHRPTRNVVPWPQPAETCSVG